MDPNAVAIAGTSIAAVISISVIFGCIIHVDVHGMCKKKALIISAIAITLIPITE